jgi:hypothetical protein
MPNHQSLQDTRVSAIRLASIASELSDLDRAIVGLVAQTRLVSGGQLERLFWSGGSPGSDARQARKVLVRLTRWRLLDRLPRRIGGRRAGSRGFVYSLGPAGVRLLARETGARASRLVRPGERYVRHVLSCTELVVRLEEATRRGDLEVIEIQSEPQCWRGFLGPFGARLMLKPDLFVRVGVGVLEDRWMIEVDLATEGRGALVAKFDRYLAHYRSGSEQRDHGIYPRVLWATPDTRRARQVEEALGGAAAPAKRLVTVCLLDEVIGSLQVEAGS